MTTTATTRTQEERLGKIRGLLAKAEKTTFPEEAKSFSAKAEELMTKWAIDEAMIAGAVDDGTIGTTDIIIPANEYRGPKVQLLAGVARVNDCRVILERQRYVCDSCKERFWGYRTKTGNPCGKCDGGKAVRVLSVEVIGFQRDREFVESLFTSLLVQAQHEFLGREVQERMRAECTQGGHRIAWRNAFMQGYAGIIVKRLYDIKAARVKQAESDGSAGVSIVLADRRGLVDKRFEEMYPKTTQSRSSAGRSYGSGYGLGREAGHRADVGQPKAKAPRGELRG